MTKPWKSPLFGFHVLTHASLILMLLYATGWEWAISVLMYFLFGCIGVACTFHRYVSHKSFQAPKWFFYLGMILGSLGGVGTSIQWTAVHRMHHRFSDTDKDPHNPSGSIWNFLKMQFFAMLVPGSPKYVPDLLRSKDHVFFHKYYWVLHAVYALVLLLIDPFAVVYAYLFPCLLLWHAMASLGTFSHTKSFGYANYPEEGSRNISLFGWLIFGEGWHNNHHKYAASYRFGEKTNEVDLTAWIIEKVRTDEAKKA